MMWLLSRIIFCIVLAWCAGFVCYFIWVSTLVPYSGHAEGIVVFTGGDRRVEVGLKLLQAEKADYLLISGVNPQVKKRELLALHHKGIELADQIDLGFAAQDTLGNADETAQWVREKKIQSLIIVTSYYHMPRALVHMGTVLPDVALYAYPVRMTVPMAQEDSLAGRMQRFLQNLPWRVIFNDYNKFLLTYPQILLLDRER